MVELNTLLKEYATRGPAYSEILLAAYEMEEGMTSRLRDCVKNISE